MPKDKPQARSGQRLKAVRLALGISTRDVEHHSRRVAEFHDRSEFYISHSSLIEIENADHTPGVHKLYSLSVIYRISFVDLLSFYGIDLDRISKAQLAVPLPKTHMVKPAAYDSDRPVVYPRRVNTTAQLEETNLLSRMVAVWGELPIPFAREFDARAHTYGFIGLRDFTLYPMIRPGALVEIDDQDKNLRECRWESEFERPIFFFQLREGFACGWCHAEGKAINIVPHPLSGVRMRGYAYPGDIQVVGRVTGVATTITKTLDSRQELLDRE
ncbi:MAG TPA: helix-turn-helix transcriptional regulator [Candidatus Acidoferrales bacterium]|nr:helix-turn-helix transcriptional regulator [Candidatus Acidoferrales bacterium]